MIELLAVGRNYKGGTAKKALPRSRGSGNPDPQAASGAK
jgi:hypothetical protein